MYSHVLQSLKHVKDSREDNSFPILHSQDNWYNIHPKWTVFVIFDWFIFFVESEWL